MPSAFRMVISLVAIAVAMSLGGCNSSDSVGPSGPILSLSKTSLTFQAVAGSVNPPSQQVIVTNSGTGEMTYSVIETASWINTLPNTGNIIYVEVYISGLAAGEHVDTLIVTSPQAQNSPRKIAVKLTIQNGMSVSPSTIRFTALRNGDNPPVQKLTVTNYGGGLMPFTVAAVGSWITLSKTAGNATDTVDVGAASSTLTSGIYGGSLTVTVPDAANSQAVVACSLMVSSWDHQLLGTSYDLRSLDFTDDLHGWITGFIGNNPGHVGVILRTEDGGGHWTQVHLENNTNMGGIDMIDQNNGWAVGDSAVLLRTLNGIDWTRITDLPVTDSVNLWRVHFVSSTRGWIAGTSGVILHTNDGGDTWNVQTSNVGVSLANIFFIDENEGWIVGNNGKILHTTLAGHDWTVLPSGTISDLWGVYFSDKNNGWVVGRDGLMLRTANGGQSWISSFPGPSLQYQQIHFADDALHGWIVGQHGTIMYTSDGGVTWIQQLTGADNWLFDVLFFDNERGFVVGEEGLVLKTLGGGF